MFYTKEREIFLSLVISAITIITYSIYLYNTEISINPELLNLPKFWGKSFLILIPISIVIQIIMHIIFAIINKILTNEEVPTLSDERDKLIELKGIKIAHWIFVIGFLLAMGSQAFDYKISVMFFILFIFGFISAFAEGIVQIYYYKKGI
ncbi:MAG TPA: hypothetical protein PL041_08655 [Melioribacteraceae bacterium]|nr:hypothetical protein [Melioribacteraceae bacterium]